MKKQCMLCHVPDCYLEKDEDVKQCPIYKCLSIIGKKRTMIVLLVLETPMRYGELRRTIPDITEKVLITILRNLEKVGYIEKHKIEGKHLKSTYTITDRGKKILQLAKDMAEIGKDIDL